MNKRKATIGPYQLGALDALNTIVNWPLILERVPKMDAEALFYSCMIQSGVEEFEIFAGQARLVGESNFLSKRTSLISDEVYHKGTEMVTKTFESYLPDGYRTDEKYSSIWTLQSLLTDLFVSLERKTSMVCILPMPDLAETEGLIPPELFYPLENLLHSFDSENATLPLPRSSISSENVRDFQDIITSDLFSQYCSTHKQLDDNRFTREKAILDTAKAGRALFQKHKKLLYLKNLTISLLPVTARIIDVIFGKLPGILAEYSTNLVSTWLEDERRITLYHFHPMFERIILKRLISAFRDNMETNGS